MLGRKWLLLEARRCGSCGLIYRWPVETEARARNFYRQNYADESDGGRKIRLPEIEELEKLRATRFAGSGLDQSEKIRIAAAGLPRAARVLDYGASWGYAVFQFKQMGFRAEGFELSEERAEFGRRNLGVEISTDSETFLERNRGSFDLVYVHHAMEHFARLRKATEDLKNLLKPDGRLFIAVPNAGGRQAVALGVCWGPMIGEAHAQAFDAAWFHRALDPMGLKTSCFSDPLTGESGDPECRGEELFCVASRR